MYTWRLVALLAIVLVSLCRMSDSVAVFSGHHPNKGRQFGQPSARPTNTLSVRGL